MKKGYIYELVFPNNKKYIGQTIDYNRRFQEYTSNFNSGRLQSKQPKLYNAIKKYGFGGILKNIIEEINAESLQDLQTLMNEKEIYYISEFNSINNGYNISFGGNQGRLGIKETEEQIQKKRDVWTEEKRLLQSEKFKGENNPRYGSIEKTYSKEVNQYDTSGKFIKTWESAAQIEQELGYNAQNIGKVCLEKLLTAYDFIWKFNNGSIDNIIPIESKQGKQSKKGINSIAVLQYSKDGTFIKEFPSIKAAEEDLNIEHSNISACAKGKRKTAGGFIWKYK